MSLSLWKHFLVQFLKFSHYSLLTIYFSRIGHHRGVRFLETCDFSPVVWEIETWTLTLFRQFVLAWLQHVHIIVFLQISSFTKWENEQENKMQLEPQSVANGWDFSQRVEPSLRAPAPGAIHFANLSPIQTPSRRRNDQLGEEGQSTSSDSQQNCAKPTYTGVRLAHDSVGCVAGPRTNQVTHQTLTIPTRTQLLPPLC